MIGQVRLLTLLFRLDQKLPGLSLAIATTEGRLLFEGGYGFADVATRRRVTPATVFRLWRWGMDGISMYDG